MDYLQLAKAKETEWGPLFGRMDQDRDLVNLIKYILRDTEPQPKPIPHAVSVTLNDPSVFATNIEASLGQANEQVTVTSENKDLDTTDIETLIKACFTAADTRLSQIGRFPLVPFIDQQTCRRGRTAARCMFRFEQKKLVCDIMPWDTRFVTYSYDKDGLLWAAYHTVRSPDLVLAEYPDLKGKVDEKQKTLNVRDIWAKDGNQVWVEDVKAFEDGHKYNKVPVVIRVVPLGSMLVDSLEFEGESIFLMIRDIIPELNRIASLIQSLNQKELDHALQEKVDREDMDAVSPAEHDQVTNPRAVTKTTGGFTPVPIGELRQQASLLNEMLERRMQRGGISNFELGTFSQAMSAVALIKIGQGRDQVFMPRLGTRGLLKQGLAEMFIEQILEGPEKARSVQVGRQTFELAPLKEEYDIEFKYSVHDASVDVARQSLATAQRGLLPDKVILRDTLQREDPDGDQRDLYSQQAEQLFPIIKMKRILRALAEKAEKGDEDAQQDLELGLAQMGVTLDQMMAGQVPTGQTEEPTKEPMAPLFDMGSPVSRMTQGASNG